MTTLLIGRNADIHVDAVLLALEQRGERVVRIDPENISPENTFVSWRTGGTVIRTLDGDFDPCELDGVFCRYAMEAIRTESVNPMTRFAFDEFWVALRGILLGAHTDKWINDPFQEAVADHKPLQLLKAKKIGFQVPSSIISQVRDELLAFAEEHEKCVIKPISDTGLASNGKSFSNEIDPTWEGDVFGSFSAKFEPKSLWGAPASLTCPVMLQELIEKDFDLRVTVIDDKVFAAKLRPGSNASLDIRNNHNVEVSSFDFSKHAERLAAFVRGLGLRFASCDFLLEGEDLFFLEANPSGNWLWTEHGADLPISEAIANALVRGRYAS